jgi:hypothetical protein
VPLASFLDTPGVVPGILGGWVFLIFLIRVFRPRRWDNRPLGIWLLVGLLVLGILMGLTDWLVDEVF